MRASLYRQRLRDLKKKEEARQRALARERLRVEAEAEQAVRDAEIDAAIARGTIPAATLPQQTESLRPLSVVVWSLC